MMEINKFFKSIIEQDTAAVVICDTAHRIVYMNPAAIASYHAYGGANLVGKSLLCCHNDRSADAIRRVVAWFAASPEHTRVHTFFNEKQQKDVYMVALRDDDGNLIGYYEKHEYRAKDDTPFYVMP